MSREKYPLQNVEDPPSKRLMSRRGRLIAKFLLSTSLAVSAIAYGYNQNQKIDKLQAEVSQSNKKNDNQPRQIEDDFARLSDIPPGVVTGTSLKSVPSVKGLVSEANTIQSEDSAVEVLVHLDKTIYSDRK